MSLHFLQRQVQGVWKGTGVPEGTQESAGVHGLGLGASSLLQPGPSSVPEDWEIIGVTALRAPRRSHGYCRVPECSWGRQTLAR